MYFNHVFIRVCHPRMFLAGIQSKKIFINQIATTSERGFVLVLMMLFLLVLSLLAFSVLDNSLLESKIIIYYQNKIKSFYAAEKLLVQKEKQIIAGSEDTNIYDLKFIDPEICGVTFYRISARANCNGAQSKLQSILAKVGDVKDCSVKPNITHGRQAFLIE